MPFKFCAKWFVNVCLFSESPSLGFPRPFLPPITYKRRYEDDDDEFDSEMEDFIDDEGEPQEVISQHIKEIFGYDRNR